MPAAMTQDSEWIDVPFRVLKEHDGRRLDAFLAERLGKKYSRMAVQKLIDDGLVSRATRPVKAAAECAACGIIFAKFKKKLETLEPAAAPAANPWLARSVAIAVLIAWMIGLSLYYRRAVAVMRVSNPRGPARPR